MKARYVAIYGGTNLPAPEAKFVRRLAHSVLERSEFVLVTGGFGYFLDFPKRISTDRSAQRGAKEYLKAEGIPLDKRLETWLPGKEKDRPGVRRLPLGRVRRLNEESAQARRFTLVKDVDALVTIKGKINTAMVLDLALAINKPALPLPFTGGDSRRYWRDHRQQICEWFTISEEFATELERTRLEKLSAPEMGKLCEKIVDSLVRGVARKCLVLMPFDEELDKFYRGVIQRTINSRGFKAIRIDHTSNTGGILDIFLQELNDCDGVIVDVTDQNPNVMYELGQAHARGVTPLLLYRGELGDHVRDRLPFYLWDQKVENGDTESERGRRRLVQSIKEYLDQIVR